MGTPFQGQVEFRLFKYDRVIRTSGGSNYFAYKGDVPGVHFPYFLIGGTQIKQFRQYDGYRWSEWKSLPGEPAELEHWSKYPPVQAVNSGDAKDTCQAEPEVQNRGQAKRPETTRSRSPRARGTKL